MNFCMEVWRMKPEFENKKNLHVTQVWREANDCSHLSYAWQKAAAFSDEIESIDNTELTLK